MLSKDTIKDIIKLGGNVKLPETFSVIALTEFAELANKHNVKLTIPLGNLSAETIKNLVRIAKNNITIELY